MHLGATAGTNNAHILYMFPLDYIDPFWFLMALCVGLLYTYILSPEPKVVVKYPTPLNAGKITYIDDAGVCYKYRVESSTCPTQSHIKKMPLQRHQGDANTKAKA